MEIEEDKLIAGEVEQRDGLGDRAVQGAGVDDSHRADASLTVHVRVTVEDVARRFAIERRAELALVAVKHPDLAPRELDTHGDLRPRESERADVTARRGARVIAVSPDEIGVAPREQIQHAVVADVAAVEKRARAAPFQQRDGLRCRGSVTVTVRHDTDDHAIPGACECRGAREGQSIATGARLVRQMPQAIAAPRRRRFAVIRRRGYRADEMFAAPLWLQLCLVPLLIGLNAFFVAAEYAVVTIRRTRVEELRQLGLGPARVLARLKTDMGGSLATIQICITATNLLIGAVAEPTMTSVLVRLLSPLGWIVPMHVARPAALAAGLLIVTFFTVVLSELLPKALTLQHTERIAFVVARPVAVLRVVCAPLVVAMEWTARRIAALLGLHSGQFEEPIHSEEELEMLVDRADDAGEFHEEHGELLRRAFDFADLVVRHVMIAMRDAAVIDSNMSISDLAQRISDRPHTRWALRDLETGRINGIVNVKMALYAISLSVNEAVILHDLATPPFYVDPELPLIDALTQMRRARQHLAVVRDSAGVELGLVTLEDIVAAIVGRIPSDVAPARVVPKRPVRH